MINRSVTVSREEDDSDLNASGVFDWASAKEDDHDPTSYDSRPEMSVILNNIYIL